MAKKRKRDRRRSPPPPPARTPPARTRALLLAAAAVAGIVVAAGGIWLASDDASGERPAVSAGGSLDAADPGPVHVHGLGVDPSDGSLYIATHTGLWRARPGERRAERVGDDQQDTMGFTVVGARHFVGSGHPDNLDEPPLLGLIESRDAGETWTPVSLYGEADFHVLRFAGSRLYGYDASGDRLLASRDGGRTWTALERPARVADLAASSADPARVLATTEEGLFESSNGGRTWRRVSDAFGLLAWPTRRAVFLVDPNGDVLASADGGRRWERRGAIGGEPAALLARSADELLVALHDGTIKRSTDGGVTWAVRSTP